MCTVNGLHGFQGPAINSEATQPHACLPSESVCLLITRAGSGTGSHQTQYMPAQTVCRLAHHWARRQQRVPTTDRLHTCSPAGQAAV